MMVDRYAAEFQYLGDARRVHEAVRIMLYARLGHAMLKRLAPHVPAVVSGWGGDRWMRFSDFYVGLDRLLPGDVIFAALDNIDPSAAPTVAAAYGKLAPGRRRWPIPWWESDGAGTRRDQWGPQCNARPCCCRFAATPWRRSAKACWPSTGGLATSKRRPPSRPQFAWNPQLTYEQFFDGFAPLLRAGLGRRDGRRPPRTRSLGAAIHRRPGPDGMRWIHAKRLLLVRRPAAAQAGESCQARRALCARIADVRREMLEKDKTAGLPRIDWLLTTIDWLTRYDAAAVVLCKGGKVDLLLAKAEVKLSDGDKAAVRELADQAAELFRNCGFAEALQTYPWKMTTCGEWVCWRQST